MQKTPSDITERPKRTLSFLRKREQLSDKEKLKKIRERKTPRKLFDKTREELRLWQEAMAAERIADKELVPHGCVRGPIINKIFR